MVECKHATWHLKMNLIQNINVRLIGSYVGTKIGAYKLRLHTYLPTYLGKKKGGRFDFLR